MLDLLLRHMREGQQILLAAIESCHSRLTSLERENKVVENQLEFMQKELKEIKKAKGSRRMLVLHSQSCSFP